MLTIINAAHISRKKNIIKMFNYLKNVNYNKICILSDVSIINTNTYGFKLFNCNGNFYDRVLFGLNKIDTQYVLIIAEDDIYNPCFMKKAVTFLNNNNKYISVCGLWVCFNENNKKIINTPMQKYYNIKFTNLINKKSNIEDTYNRILFNMKKDNLLSPIDNIHKTKYMKVFFNFLVNNNEYQSFSYIDRLGIIFFNSIGKIKCINSVMILKNQIKKLRNLKDESNLELKKLGWNNFYNHYYKFNNFIINRFSLKSEKFFNIINNTKKIWNVYSNNNINKNLIKSVINNEKLIINNCLLKYNIK